MRRTATQAPHEAEPRDLGSPVMHWLLDVLDRRADRRRVKRTLRKLRNRTYREVRARGGGRFWSAVYAIAFARPIRRPR